MPSLDPLEAYDRLARSTDGVDTLGGVGDSLGAAPAAAPLALEPHLAAAVAAARAAVSPTARNVTAGASDDLSGDDLSGQELLGSLWGSIKKRLKKAHHLADAVVHTAAKVGTSTEFRAVVGAVSVAIPALAPAGAALIAAGELAKQLETGEKAAIEAKNRLQRLAKRGDPTAKRALAHLKVAQAARRVARRAGISVPHGATVKPPSHSLSNWGELHFANGRKMKFQW